MPKNSTEKIHVILMSWKRLEGTKSLLKDIAKQTYQNFKLTVINNNIDYKDELEEFVKGIFPTAELIHNEQNLSCRERFVYAKQTDCQWVVFFDDDQFVGETCLEEMLNVVEEKTICTWWGWECDGSYWERTRQSGGGKCHYGGTDGMILDSSIFQNENFWTEWDPKFHAIATDLWLSCFATQIGWEIRGYSELPIKFNSKLANDENALYLQKGAHDLKEELFIKHYGKK